VQLMPGKPAYVQVAADLREQIMSGTLAVDSQLPSMSQLRAIYQVSNTVIRDALSELRREGLTHGQQGKGVFVRARPEPSENVSDEARSIFEHLDALTRSVRRLDERLAVLERTVGQGPVAQHQARPDVE
jgi:GntR family transcriptional regulator